MGSHLSTKVDLPGWDLCIARPELHVALQLVTEYRIDTLVSKASGARLDWSPPTRQTNLRSSSFL